MMKSASLRELQSLLAAFHKGEHQVRTIEDSIAHEVVRMGARDLCRLARKAYLFRSEDLLDLIHAEFLRRRHAPVGVAA